jgi:hypothetical protein
MYSKYIFVEKISLQFSQLQHEILTSKIYPKTVSHPLNTYLTAPKIIILLVGLEFAT